MSEWTERETCPTILMNGDEIVEVTLTTWMGTKAGDDWRGVAQSGSGGSQDEPA